MSETASFPALRYFPGEHEVAAIEERLMAAQGPDWFRLATEMAWYCRQEPSDRPLDLAARIIDLLPGAGLDAREETAIRTRLELVRAEIACTRSDYDEADRLFRGAMAQAESLSDPIAYGDALCGLGFALWQGNALKRAEESFSAARSAYMRAGDRHRAAYSYFVLAALAAYDNAAKALAKYGAAIATDDQEQDPVPGPYIKAYLARPALLRGEVGAAMRFWNDGHALALKSRQYLQAVLFLMALGESYYSLNDYDAALDHFNRAVELARGLRSKFLIAINLGHIADVMRALKRPAEARDFLETMFKSWQGQEHSRWFIVRLNYFAEVTLDLGDAGKALELFDDAIRRIGAIGVVQPLDRAMTGKARALLALDRLNEALAAAEQALLIGHDTGAVPNRIEAMRIIASIFRKRGQAENALATYAGAEAIAAGVAGYALSPDLFNEIGAVHSECGNFRAAYDYALKAQAATDSTRVQEAGNRVIAMQIRHETERAQMEAAHQRALAELQASRVAELEAAQAALRALLDNADQGFLTVDRKLDVAPQYSAICRQFLGGEPAGRPIFELLHPDTPAQAHAMRATLAGIYAEASDFIRALKIELLPKEFEIGNHTVFAGYKWLPEAGQLMMVLSDVTEARALDVAVSRERRRLQMLALAVTESRSFVNLVEDYECFIIGTLPQLLAGFDDDLDYEELKRRVHEFRHLLQRFSFHHSPALLDEFDALLAQRSAVGTVASLSEKSQALEPALRRDLENVAGLLGEDYLPSGGRIAMSGDQLRGFERLAVEALTGEAGRIPRPELHQVLVGLSRLRAMDVTTLLRLQSRRAASLARKSGKQLEVHELAAIGDVRLPQDYAAFFRSMSELFRFIVERELETPEIRVRQGKPEAGSLSITLGMSQDALELNLAIDGRGIDRAALEGRLVAEGDDPTRVSELSLAELVVASASGLSGLADELERIGGTLSVESEGGKGARFSFDLPLPGVGLIADREQMVEIVERRLIAFFRDEMELDTRGVSRRMNGIGDLPLRKLTALVTIGPASEHLIAFSYDSELIEELARRYSADLDEALPQDVDLNQETALELINLIIGNCTAELAQGTQPLQISPPVLVTDARLIYGHGEGRNTSLTLAFDVGVLDVTFITPARVPGGSSEEKGAA